MSEAVRSGPLAGVRVVDWTQFGVGPFASSLLGAMGADVIHVEAPTGDPQIKIPPTIKGVAGFYVNFNMSKRSIHLDMREDEHRDRMWELIEGADVLVSNLKPSSLEKLGYGADAVLARNPGIVYCVANGWGESGPMAGRAGADNQVQAYSGWCSVTGDEDGEWEFLRYLGQIDLNSSLYITAAVLTGLATRSRFGGQAIKLSMLETAIAMQSSRIAEYLTGSAPGPLGSAAAVVAPSQAFACEGGDYLAVAAETEGQWQRLCEAIEQPALAERPEYRTNADRVANRRALAAELGQVFLAKPVRWWLQVLQDRNVPSSHFWDFELISHHAQVRENEHVIQIDAGRFGKVHTNGTPWKFEQAPARVTRNPYSGEHTDEVRAELKARIDAGENTPPASVPAPPRDTRPFGDLRVIELSTGIAGPYCGALLADQGADVLKLEPAGGDHTRGWGPPFDGGVGAAFFELNRNKRLGTPPDEGELFDLVSGADIVIVDAVDPDGNPPVVDLTRAREQNPRLIVCSISAYGEAGPMAGLPGCELTVQAMCNTWGGLGAIGEAPRRLGADQASMNAGLTGYQAVTAALFRREQTGEGDWVRTSLLGAHHAVKSMHWTSLSHPDQWPGLHLRVWTDPPQHGVKTADRPILLFLYRGLAYPMSHEQVRGMIEHFGGSFPDGLDVNAPWGTPGHFMHPQWSDFFTGLFKDTPSAEVERVVEAHGGEITPWLSYKDFDDDEHVSQHVRPFVELEGAAGRRVVRLPWHLGAADDPAVYRVPVEVAADDVTQSSTPVG